MKWWRNGRLAALVLAGGCLAIPDLVAGQVRDTSMFAGHPSRGGRYGGVPDRLTIRGGALFADHRTRLRVDSETLGAGTLVDLESDLGLETTTRDVRVDASLRLGRRHQLRGGYIALDRGATRRLKRQVQWGDRVFGVDEDVTSVARLVLIPLQYRFSPIRTDRVDLGLSAGVFAAFADASLTAPTSSIDEAESLDVPLPVLGADIDIALAPRVFLLGGVDYFALRFEGVDGSWSELKGGIEVLAMRNLGAGLAYRYVSIEVDGTGRLGDGSGTDVFFDYEFHGPQAYVTIAF